MKKIRCTHCNEPKVKLEIIANSGYLAVVQGEARINNCSDGTQTVDFYCDTCKEEV